MSSIKNDFSENKEKIKITYKKVIKNKKSKKDVKKESDELILKLRVISMERKIKNIKSELKCLKNQEKYEERNLRIFNALYATPFDDTNKRKKELFNVPSESIIKSSDSDTESSDISTSLLQKQDKENNKKIKSRVNIINKKNTLPIDVSKKDKFKNNFSFHKNNSLPSLLTDTESQNESLKKNYLLSSKTNYIFNDSNKTEKTTSLSNVSIPFNKRNDSEFNNLHKKDLEKSSNTKASEILPVTVIILQKENIHFNRKLNQPENNENGIMSSTIEPQLGGFPGKGIPAPDNVVSEVMKKINEKKQMLDDTISLRCVFRNGFTNKIQFIIFHPLESTLESLMLKLQNQHNFTGHLFYNGKELIGDKKKLSDFNISQNVEFVIIPKITSGDYSLQQYSQLNKNLNQKKKFFQNIKNALDNTENLDVDDITTKKFIHKFVTMTEKERKNFDKDMKNKFKKLKEMRDDKRRKKKAFFTK
ncbi:Hypothetical protein SRAE_1000015300 [Strongyloides ratti]|uniref:Ubiquitin-like domain-containing protein n=1 Tax=Strongyloides ratti TaxID=34506 RepID=A0A090L184_STRRB|nr:Hypothetical protein SRAE_1000015300 [Strongyloides ratti]CEF61877.1 Hypothetical protein SRAE_1000015300 [Strongyloides ratti]